MLTRMWNKWTVHSLLGRIHTTHFGKHLMVFSKEEDIATIWPSKHTLRTDSGKMCDICPQKYFYINVHRSFICDCSNCSTPNVHQLQKGFAKSGILTQGNTTLPEKGIYLMHANLGWISKEFFFPFFF